MSTQDIIDSLRPGNGNEEALTVKPDGTITDGNTRVKVLRERGVDVDRLPREPHPNEGEAFPRLRSGRSGGGGGGSADIFHPRRGPEKPILEK